MTNKIIRYIGAFIGATIVLFGIFNLIPDNWYIFGLLMVWMYLFTEKE